MTKPIYAIPKSYLTHIHPEQNKSIYFVIFTIAFEKEQPPVDIQIKTSSDRTQALAYKLADSDDLIPCEGKNWQNALLNALHQYGSSNIGTKLKFQLYETDDEYYYDVTASVKQQIKNQDNKRLRLFQTEPLEEPDSATADTSTTVSISTTPA